MGDRRRVRGPGRVRRAPLLRRFDAVRKRVVQRQRPAGLPDLATGTRRLRGPDRVLAARRVALAPGVVRNRRRDDRRQPGDRFRRIVRRHVGRLVPYQVSRHRRRVGGSRVMLYTAYQDSLL